MLWQPLFSSSLSAYHHYYDREVFWKITVWLWIRASAQRACSKMKMLIGLSRLVQRSSSGWASVCGRAGGRPAAPPQPAGEACWRHAQPGPKFKEQHSGSAEHHQTGQPGNWMHTYYYYYYVRDDLVLMIKAWWGNIMLRVRVCWYLVNLFHSPPPCLWLHR